MSELAKRLNDMPDEWGKVFRPAMHPSSVGIPACPRYFMFRVRLGWDIPKWREALDSGQVFHSVQAAVRSGASLSRALETVQLTSEQTLTEVENDYIAAFPDATRLDLRPQRKALALGLMLAHVWNENFPLPDTWKVLAVERAFSMPLGAFGMSGRLEGTLDTVLYDPDKEHTWLEDHKSTGMDPVDRSRGLSFDTQSLLYRALWDYANPKQRLFGTIHNIISKPTIRQKTRGKEPENFDEYVARCYDQYDLKALPDPQHPPFIQSHLAFIRPPLSGDAELLGLLALTSPWYGKALSLAAFPRAGKSYGLCTSQGRVCKYMPLCEASPSGWHALLTRMYWKTDPDTKTTRPLA